MVDHHKSITFVGNGHVISRGSITTVSDNQRSWYNPAMFEINNWTTSASHTLTLNGVIVDDRGVAAGTQYVQATSNQDNTNVKVFTTMGIATALVGILAFFKRKNR